MASMQRGKQMAKTSFAWCISSLNGVVGNLEPTRAPEVRQASSSMFPETGSEDIRWLRSQDALCTGQKVTSTTRLLGI